MREIAAAERARRLVRLACAVLGLFAGAAAVRAQDFMLPSRPAPSAVVVTAPALAPAPGILVPAVSPVLAASPIPVVSPAPVAVLPPPQPGLVVTIIPAPRRFTGLTGGCLPGFARNASGLCARYESPPIACAPDPSGVVACTPLPPDPLPYGLGAALRLNY